MESYHDPNDHLESVEPMTELFAGGAVMGEAIGSPPITCGFTVEQAAAFCPIGER